QYGEQAVTEMTAQYMGKITHLDHRVGEIIAALKQRGNWENTVIVFSADHGDNMGEHGRVSKGGFQDGSARVPLIISGSAALISARGDRNPSPVSFLDLFPTFLELAGAKIPDYCQATSLLPILRGESDGVNDAVFSEIANGDSFNYMVRDQRWKWYLQTRNNRQGLFDMERDPHEMRNLISSTAQADTLQRLRDRMLHFLLVTQLNQGRGYQPLFKRLGMTFASQDQDERKRIICQRLGQVHS
ncbi:MAG: sulfatase-like hydrolase/transferase, partial [Candidatus Poribacteria bacterium]|nr:sulfatase-like hydrolase/transferase [Candidatus Poribacteria bacterium]